MTRLTTTIAASTVALTLGAIAPSPAAAQSFSSSSNMTVNCGPGRSAVIRQLDGMTQVNCVGTTTARRSVASRAAQQRYVPDVKRRSWQKSALMIGGSAGTGAGIGAIVGGKKGALIGAALGGGSASIYDASRRR